MVAYSLNVCGGETKSRVLTATRNKRISPYWRLEFSEALCHVIRRDFGYNGRRSLRQDRETKADRLYVTGTMSSPECDSFRQVVAAVERLGPCTEVVPRIVRF